MALSPNIVALAGSSWLLRLGGQGLMSHIAMTTTARRFPQDRGKTLGLVALGFAAGEAAVLAPVLAALRWFMAERSMIVITHRDAVAATFDRVRRLGDGRLSVQCRK